MDFFETLLAQGVANSQCYTKSETDALLAVKAPAGQNYIETLNGTRIYVGSATPTGTIPTGSVWIGG